MSIGPESPGKAAAFAWVAHRRQCRQCERADLRMDMCPDGQPMYDDMITAAYVAGTKRGSGT